MINKLSIDDIYGQEYNDVNYELKKNKKISTNISCDCLIRLLISKLVTSRLLSQFLLVPIFLPKIVPPPKNYLEELPELLMYKL
jgi:hypothetical protein